MAEYVKTVYAFVLEFFDATDKDKWGNCTEVRKDETKKKEQVIYDSFFKFADLSNFPGAVAARSADGKSEVDRLWICADDRADPDGSRQVFAYVVEGLETVRSICEVDFAQEDDELRGFGKPAENIAIESVVKVDS